MGRNKGTMRAAIAACTAIMAATPAWSQAALEEIVVTTQKREQSLQDVPIAVTAVSDIALRAGAITNIFDLRAQVPALDIRAVDPPSVGTAFALRGLGTSVFNMGFEPTVATFVDGVYRSRSGLLASTDFVDMERIEVIKGPQGTLFGKNTTGGVVSMFTKKPNLDQTEGFVEASYEEYGRLHTNGAVNVPLAAGKAALRLTGGYAKGDGWLDNKVTGNEIHDLDRYNIRAQLLVLPTENLSVRVIADYAKLDEACCTALHYVDDPTSAAVNGGVGAIVPPADIENYDVALNVDPEYKAEDTGISAEINWEIGEVTLTSISAWRKFEDENFKDNDFGGVDILLSNQNLPEVKLASQELRLSGTCDCVLNGLDWTVGAFYSKENIELTNEFIWGPQFFIPFGIGQRAYLAAFDQEIESMAAFAHGIFHLSDRLSLTLGLRLTKDEKDGKLVNDHPTVAAPFGTWFTVWPLPVVHDYDDSKNDKEPSGTISLQYDFSEETMGYLSYTHGYKSGGISMTRDAAGVRFGFPPGPPGAASDPTFDKETADSFELGVKSTLMDRRLRLLGALWRTEFTDLQVQTLRTDGSFAVSTADGALSQGMEFEANLLATEHLSFNVSVQYLFDAEYDGSVGALTPGLPELGGESLANAADWVGTIGMNYEQPIGDSLAVFFNASLFAQDEARLSAEINPSYDQVQDGYELLTLRAGVKAADEQWELAAWCRNCADESYATSKFKIPFDGYVFGGSTVWSHVGMPRMIGVTGTWRW